MNGIDLVLAAARHSTVKRCMIKRAKAFTNLLRLSAAKLNGKKLRRYVYWARQVDRWHWKAQDELARTIGKQP